MSQIPPLVQQDRIDGLTRLEWEFVNRTFSSDPGFQKIFAMVNKEAAEHHAAMMNCHQPERQFELHQSIGFLKCAEYLLNIRDRAAAIVKGGVSPDAATETYPPL